MRYVCNVNTDFPITLLGFQKRKSIVKVSRIQGIDGQCENLSVVLSAVGFLGFDFPRTGFRLLHYFCGKVGIQSVFGQDSLMIGYGVISRTQNA